MAVAIIALVSLIFIEAVRIKNHKYKN